MRTDASAEFILTLGQPALLCSADLTVRCLNDSFSDFAGPDAAVGSGLGLLFPELKGVALPEGTPTELELRPPTGRPLVFRFYRRGDAVAALGLRPSPRMREQHAELEQALLELGRELASAAGEEHLVAVVAGGVKRLLPGRHFCVRIIDAKTGALTSLYAEGPLRQGAKEVLVLRRRAMEKTRLNAAAIPPVRVEITDGELPLLFTGTVGSISAPLVASGQLFGAIHLEYAAPPHDLATDERLLVQLANQAAVGVRNAKLIDELTFVRKYLEELLENANALIVATNRERRVLVFNQAFSSLTGLSKEQVLGRDLLELIPDTEQPRALGALADSIRGERVNFETVVRAPGGREVRVALATSNALNAQGEVEGVIAIGQDLTVVRDLERRVVQAEKLSSLGKLAASVAHEINNPMTAVAAYVDSFLDRAQAGLPPPPDEAEKLRKVRDNSQRILRFTQDLVSYARPASDRPQELALHPTLDLAVSFCSHELEQNGVQVVRDYGEIPPLLGVPAHLVQVFVNLITNACHAMERGGTVRLVTRVEEERAVIRVEDTGTGIEPGHLKQIFEPFFTTKPAGKGTGLGLSIVHGIVEKHGGKVEVQSAPGAGAVFSVRLPLPDPGAIGRAALPAILAE